MTEFSGSSWDDGEYARNYLDKADVYIVDRRKMFGIVASFVSHFARGRAEVSVLDLGCGDGALTAALLRSVEGIVPTLLDGGEMMLKRAQERLAEYPGAVFIRASFQDLLAGRISLGTYDFIVSSMALHHLDSVEKRSFFQRIALWLNPGGYFINMDTVLPPSEALEEWYFAMWREWMSRSMSEHGIRDETPDDLIRRYKDPSGMNRPDTIGMQLRALQDAGFVDVDCYYKNGVFAVFGGRI